MRGTWINDEDHCQYLLHDECGNIVAKVFTIFAPLHGIDGYFYSIKGIRKPWLKISEPFTGWENAKYFCERKVVEMGRIKVDRCEDCVGWNEEYQCRGVNGWNKCYKCDVYHHNFQAK